LIDSRNIVKDIFEAKEKMSSPSLQTTAFILSLIGGIIILVGSLITSLLSAFGSPNGTYYGMGPGMMGRFGFGFGYGSGWMLGLSIIALICGILVLVGAVMINSRPVEHFTWGIIVLIFSIVSLIGMGGYFIGAILGIAGGAIALSYRKSSVDQKE
jgi:hypothetical protein